MFKNRIYGVLGILLPSQKIGMFRQAEMRRSIYQYHMLFSIEPLGHTN